MNISNIANTPIAEVDQLGHLPIYSDRSHHIVVSSLDS